MGLYDREYYREEKRGLNLASDWSAVATLIAMNVAVFLADLFTRGNWINQHFALQPDLFQHPWQFWQLLTYGFLHDPDSITHILFNMFGLWVFGSEVERVYGKQEFFKLYLSLIILSGFTNLLVQVATNEPGRVIGASGGVMGVAVIFACNFPKRVLYIWGIVPVQAMVMVIIFILLDLLAARAGNDNVAHWAHIGGAAFGFLYFKTGWNLFRLWPGTWKIKLPSRRPKFRIHREPDEDDDETAAPADDYMTTGRMQARVDQLLAKISATGESSLTSEERQFLADAAKRYQQQRRR